MGHGGRIDPDGSLVEAAGKIRLLVLDVDGVLTDGRITYTSTGDESKSFNVRDGHAVKMALRAGLGVAIITGRQSDIVKRRADELGIQLVFQGALDKMKALKEILEETHLDTAQIAYMGDDVVDLPLLMNVGLACAPADAAQEVLEKAHMVTGARGGEGAVRELILFVLKAQGLWDGLMIRYLVADDDR